MRGKSVISLKCVLAALVCAVLVTAWVLQPLIAQVRYLVGEPGTWKPWKFTATSNTRQEFAATAADVKAFEGQLLELNGILKQAAGVASPHGFSVETWGHLGGYADPAPGQPAGRTLPLAGGLDFGAFPIFEYERSGKTVRSDTGEAPLLSFIVNEIQPWLLSHGGGSRPAEWKTVNTDAFLQPPQGSDIAGLHRFGDWLILKKNPASLFVPVSVEAALKLVTAANDSDLVERRQAAVRIQASFEEWKSPAKRAERMAGYKQVAIAVPEGPAYLTKMMQFEKEQEVRLAVDAGPDGESAKGIRALEQENAGIVNSLAGLTPADRAAPACYAKSGVTSLQRFKNNPAAGCVPIARPNWQFFNASLPRSAPQILIIDGFERCIEDKAPPTNPSGCAANRRLLETLDKEAVLAWLK
jgi:hypothetical protein